MLCVETIHFRPSLDIPWGHEIIESSQGPEMQTLRNSYNRFLEITKSTGIWQTEFIEIGDPHRRVIRHYFDGATRESIEHLFELHKRMYNSHYLEFIKWLKDYYNTSGVVYTKQVVEV
jgi:hypothetical protein